MSRCKESALIPPLPDEFLAGLGRLLPGRVETSEAVRVQHANTLTWIASEPPQAVVYAEGIADVQAVVRIAGRYRVPVIAFGAGTSLEGHVNAPLGGISLDLSRMNRIIDVHGEDFDAVVEPGVSRDALDLHLRGSGLFFPVDPGAASATLGGMAATRASGTTSVRYGTMRDNVVALKAVLADGRLIATGQRARKSAAGYDLTHLLVGSEGTLGIIVELTLRLHPRPETVLAAVAHFPDIAAAARASAAALGYGLGLARIELLDEAAVAAVNRASGLELAATPALFIECHGQPAAMREAGPRLAALLADHGGWIAGTAEAEEERRRLWKARHDAFWSLRAAYPGRAALVTDVAVPLSRLAQCIAETAADARHAGIDAPIIGHLGDGNFHAVALFEAADPDASSAVQAFADRLARRAIAMEGTCTGEHGIGQGKIEALAAEAGPAAAIMVAIKSALDPQGILNPGKIFPMARDG